MPILNDEDRAELATAVRTYTRNGRTVKAYTRGGGKKPKPNHGVGGTVSKKQSPDTVSVGGGKDAKPNRPGAASGKSKSYKINQTYTSGPAKGRVAVTEKRTQVKGGTKVEQFDFQGKLVADWLKDEKTGKVIGKRTVSAHDGDKHPRDLRAERNAAKKRVRQRKGPKDTKTMKSVGPAKKF